MLIRLQINNVLSFQEEKEFNMLPYSRLSGIKGRLKHHIYPIKDSLSVLKLAAIYGANGAGKSNLIKGLSFLKDIVVEGEIPSKLQFEKFRLDEKNQDKSQVLGVEFISDGKSYYYGIEIEKGYVLTEELYNTHFGKKDPKIIFERKTNIEGKTKTTFFNKFEADSENRTLQKVIEKTLSKPEKPLFKLLSELDNDYLKELKIAYKWFEQTLQIITPKAKPVALALKISLDNKFKMFANDVICSFNTGITELQTESQPLIDFLGEENIEEVKEISQQLRNKTISFAQLEINHSGERVIVVNEGDNIVVKRLKLSHQSKQGNPIHFYLDQESDGTNRLLDFIPAFESILHEEKVYVIDEIERSLHPILIKEILRKFSLEEESKGQLIFTTHESNLLDQEILRPDEIWFVEKDTFGVSDLYPLSEFKEHKTKDIRKGYLNGRYGAIPFLGNLKDLNWNKDAVTQ